MTTSPDPTLDPVVLRFAGMFPNDLRGYEAHRTRKGGDLNHVDATRSHLNKRLIGTATWAEEASKEIRLMKQKNFVGELESLDRRNRRKDFERRTFEGPHDPWRATRHGPMRELILTANQTWFDGFDENSSEIDFAGRERRFEERAVAWLKDNFGDDVIHARADRDEAAYHIHAVIMPRATVTIKGAERRMLQPSIHPLIKDYEAAQDSVGAWFSEIGLRRGERRKQAFRKAVKAGEEPPKKRVHVRPVDWRRAEDCRLAAERKTLEAETSRVAEREAEADAVIAAADGIADGTLEIEDTDDGGPQLRATPSAKTDAQTLILERLNKSTTGQARAAQAFAAAWRRMTGRAEAAAKKTARQQLAREFADVEAADEAIVRIAALLPTGLRKRVAEARKTLTKKIMSARKTLAPKTELQTPRSGRPGAIEENKE